MPGTGRDVRLGLVAAEAKMTMGFAIGIWVAIVATLVAFSWDLWQRRRKK